MILKTLVVQDACKKILDAINCGSLAGAESSDCLELDAKDGTLDLNVTNKEYFVTVTASIDVNEPFHVVVGASLFLNLVSKITTDDIELGINGNSLEVKANGVYRLPMIFDKDKMVVLSKIAIDNPTKTMDVDSDALLSILNYNTKELQKNAVLRPVQKMFYVDEQGAISFTNTGACVNSFALADQIKLLLPLKVVKMFRLFKAGGKAKLTLGYDQLAGGILQAKIRLEAPGVVLTVLLPSDDSLMLSVPVQAIRGRANGMYPYSVTFNKDLLLASLGRLLLFFNAKADKKCGTFDFGKDGVSISTQDGISERVQYENSLADAPTQFSRVMLDLDWLSLLLEGCPEKYLILEFGANDQAVVMVRGSIRNVISQIVQAGA